MGLLRAAAARRRGAATRRPDCGRGLAAVVAAGFGAVFVARCPWVEGRGPARRTRGVASWPAPCRCNNLARRVRGGGRPGEVQGRREEEEEVEEGGGIFVVFSLIYADVRFFCDFRRRSIFVDFRMRSIFVDFR